MKIEIRDGNGKKLPKAKTDELNLIILSGLGARVSELENDIRFHDILFLLLTLLIVFLIFIK